MRLVWRIVAMTGVLLCGVVSATAQNSANPDILPAAPSPTSSGSVEDFDPAIYGIVEFDDYHDLYSRLTEPGRCPPNEMAEPRQPCALIVYRPVGNADREFGLYFKPIFEVISADRIWAMHDRQLKRVSIGNLYFDEPRLRGKPGKYVSVAVIGNGENRANCDQGRRCLSDLVAQDMFLMYKKIPDAVVERLWGNGMLSPGAIVR